MLVTRLSKPTLIPMLLRPAPLFYSNSMLTILTCSCPRSQASTQLIFSWLLYMVCFLQWLEFLNLLWYNSCALCPQWDFPHFCLSACSPQPPCNPLTPHFPLLESLPSIHHPPPPPLQTAGSQTLLTQADALIASIPSPSYIITPTLVVVCYIPTYLSMFMLPNFVHFRHNHWRYTFPT